jgi:serine acetyltransferase
LAVPQLGSCASPGRARRLWAARYSQEEGGPLGAQPPPRVLELTASKAAGLTAFDRAGVDIHPGCKLGRGVTIDHATGVTLGETCVVGDNVYIMHDVTLGATGKAKEHDRHPKIGRGVFLGAKCTVLGNIRIGDGATIAAAALVNKPVPDGYTAVGMPARLIAPKGAQGESTRSQLDLGRAK